jgi:dTDP-4-amino-4,6-dideoxygalactose transaminase
MTVVFNDFRAQYQSIKPEIDAAVARVLDSGWYLLGQELTAFETALAAYAGVDHAGGVGNGTEALALALMALEIGTGHEVIAPNLTAYPTITGIKMTGATPVVAVVDPQTGTLDPAALAARISPRTRAIMPVHLYGQCADMPAILAVAEAHGLPVIEDCAHCRA